MAFLNNSIWQCGTGVTLTSICQKAHRRFSEMFSEIIYLRVVCVFYKCSNQGFLFISLFLCANDSVLTNTQMCGFCTFALSKICFFWNCCHSNLGNLSQKCRPAFTLDYKDTSSKYYLCIYLLAYAVSCHLMWCVLGFTYFPHFKCYFGSHGAVNIMYHSKNRQ